MIGYKLQCKISPLPTTTSDLVSRLVALGKDKYISYVKRSSINCEHNYSVLLIPCNLICVKAVCAASSFILLDMFQVNNYYISLPIIFKCKHHSIRAELVCFKDR